MTERLWCVNLGTEPYGPTEALQTRLVEWRQRGLIEDVVLLLQHSPVITLGRRADPAHILATPESLAAEGVAVHQTERGGDVTYHGPGQLVGYPIVNLSEHGLGASDYMHRLEDIIAAALADFGISTRRREGLVGVWVGMNKICALGVRIKRGVTFHGFALNVAPNMAHWSLIIPCGITDGGVTSMALELPQPPPFEAVRERVAHHLARSLGLELAPMTLAELEARAAQAEALAPPAEAPA